MPPVIVPPRVPGTKWIVVGLLGLALALRLGLVAAVSDYAPLGDAADYDLHGWTLASKGRYPKPGPVAPEGPTAFRPPGYPFFLAGVYVVGGHHPNAARLAQALLGTLSVALMGLIVLRIWGRAEALAALAVGAVYPPLIVIGDALVSEVLAVPLELGALLAALEHRRSAHRYRFAVLSGALAGLAVLTRPNLVLLLIPLVIAVWPRGGLRAAAALLATGLLALVPWTIRNAITMDAFVPVSTQGGYTLAGAYNDTTRLDRRHPADWRSFLADPHLRFVAAKERREVPRERRLRSEALDYAADHPGYVLEFGYRNTLRAFLLGGRSYARVREARIGIGRRLVDLEIAGLYLVGIVALAGAFTRTARRAPLALWLVPVLLLAPVFTGSVPRYRVPIDPFIVLLAALAIAAIGSWLARRRGPPAPS